MLPQKIARPPQRTRMRRLRPGLRLRTLSKKERKATRGEKRARFLIAIAIAITIVIRRGVGKREGLEEEGEETWTCGNGSLLLITVKRTRGFQSTAVPARVRY
ncbi:hypothetical protein GW17_00000441 [Ensete ventricosum]|nr:hypothetical protein GW17_00000441 [Ensete ventricosum]